MKISRHRMASLGVWVLLAAFAALQAVAWTLGGTPSIPWGVTQALVGWVIMIVLAVIATRRIGGLAAALSRTEEVHRATSDKIGQLQLHNAMLEILARTVDVPLAFQSLALRIAGLVPCDRVGLALLSDDGEEFQTYTARMNEADRRSRPRPDVVFKAEGTAIGAAVRSRTPLIIDDTAEGGQQYLDTNVAHTSGFASALVIPLVSSERAVGTLNLVSRRRAAFDQSHVDTLLPVTEILAMAHVAQQLQIALTRHRTLESVTELTLAVSIEINSALQTIVGHCDLIERGYPDPDLQRDLATIVNQAQRISNLLEKMRSASHERLHRVAETVRAGAKF
ncbi:MAG TPA: GAF domain-containing protein [Vicinamibacterales bacterium]|nr:GAF domain-containing protein [Vicinamibacterales bacterium]